MFTGLVEATGRIDRVIPAGSSRVLRIATSLAGELRDGDSIAVSGVCLTATTCEPAGFEATVSPETLRVTTLGALAPGQRVNLERPLRADGRLGGHFVLGHVDGMGRVSGVRSDGDCRWIDVDVPEALAPGLIPKGSVAIDGISLTVAHLAGNRIGVQIVPFTLEHTTLADACVGDIVNLEMDVIGKYVARLMGASAHPAAVPDAPAEAS
jgi:riboflavin synthase